MCEELLVVRSRTQFLGDTRVCANVFTRVRVCTRATTEFSCILERVECTQFQQACLDQELLQVECGNRRQPFNNKIVTSIWAIELGFQHSELTFSHQFYVSPLTLEALDHQTHLFTMRAEFQQYSGASDAWQRQFNLPFLVGRDI